MHITRLPSFASRLTIKGLIAVAFLTTSLTGCGINHKLQYTVSNTNTPFELTDQRPEKDKAEAHGKQAGFPGYILGDNAFTPDRLAVVRDRLNHTVGDRLAGYDVVVKRLQSAEYHPYQLGIDALVSGHIATQPAHLKAIDITQHRYWAVSQLVVEVSGVQHAGLGVLGYDGARVDYAGNHTKVLLAAIDQVALSIARSPPNPR